MSLFLRIGMCACLALGVAVAAISGSPAGRSLGYGNNPQCYTRLHAELPEHVTAVVTGSSRARRSVEPEAFAKALGLKAMGAVNLAHPGVSLPFDYALLDHLTRERRIETALIEVQARSPSLAATEREIDATAAELLPRLSGDYDSLFLLSAPYLNQYALIERRSESHAGAVWDMAGIAGERIDRVLTLSLRGRPWLRGAREAPVVKGRQICFVRAWGDPHPLRQSGDTKAVALKVAYRQRFSAQTDPHGEALAFLYADETQSDREMVEALIQLGKRRGFNSLFFYLPGLEVPVDAPLLAKAFHDRFGAELLIPDQSTRALLAKGGYYDHSHLNNRGRAIFNEWLARRLDTSQPTQ